jgi:hypothetical protein
MQPSYDGAQTLTGVVGFFDDPHSLIEATRKVREENYEIFDTFTPYPVHGLEKAQGLKRSKLPYVTFGAGLTGFSCAILLQGWTSVVDWPLNVGGKPFWSWQAFVPIFFELTVLFAGLATVAGMLLFNRLPNVSRKAFDPSLTRDRFALFIGAPKTKARDDDEEEETLRTPYRFKSFVESDAQAVLKKVGAKEVRSVYAEGWF